jgi:hypothetical protein
MCFLWQQFSTIYGFLVQHSSELMPSGKQLEMFRPMNGRRGRPRILHFSDVDYLKTLIQHRPDWFLDELLYLSESNCFISAHFTTIHRELIRAGVSSKKIKKIAAERNEPLRADFIGRMAQYTPEQLGFQCVSFFTLFLHLSCSCSGRSAIHTRRHDRIDAIE